MRYPPARRLDLVEDLHGHRVADPYRWLEDADDRAHRGLVARPRTSCWPSALDGLPGRDGAFASGWSGCSRPGWCRLPVLAGRAGVLRPAPRPTRSTPVLLVRGGRRHRAGADRPERPGPTTTPSRSTAGSRRWRATGSPTCCPTGGDEESVAVRHGRRHRRDGRRARSTAAATARSPGCPAATTSTTCAGCPPTRCPAGEDAVPPPGLPPPGRHRPGRRRAGLRRRAATRPTYYGVECPRDGRWLLVAASAGTAPRNDVWIADLAGDGVLRPIQEGRRRRRPTAGSARDGRLYLHTNLDAPRCRLAVPTRRRPEPAALARPGARGPDGVLAGLRPRPTTPCVVARPGPARRRPGDGPRPATGDADGPRSSCRARRRCSACSARPEGGDEVWLGYTDFTTPPQVLPLRGRRRRTALELWAAARRRRSTCPPGDRPAGDLPLAGRHRGAACSSSTATGRPADGPRPTVLYGYGGFNISLTPAYSASRLAWVEQGGVWAVANLRGGSEEGEAWHRDGMREHKQHVFDDFAAAAEHLIAAGWTTPEQLGSLRRLQRRAAGRRRPHPAAGAVRAPWSAAPPCSTWSATSGSGSAAPGTTSTAPPTTRPSSAGCSPTRPTTGSREGTAYPAVLFTVFDSDTRVDPLHARKLCAALQAATTLATGRSCSAASGRPATAPARSAAPSSSIPTS